MAVEALITLVIPPNFTCHPTYLRKSLLCLSFSTDLIVGNSHHLVTEFYTRRVVSVDLD